MTDLFVRCADCEEFHVSGPGNRLNLRRYARGGMESLRALADRIKFYNARHPYLEVGFDGDEYSIVGVPKKRENRISQEVPLVEQHA